MAETSASPFPVGATSCSTGRVCSRRCSRRVAAARIDSYERLSRAVAARLRAAGARAGYGAPIVVDGKIWGAMAAVQTAAALARRCRGTARELHRADRNRDLQRSGRDEPQPPCGRAGIAASGRDARRAADPPARASSPSSRPRYKELFDVPDVAIVRFEQRDVVVVGAAGGNPFIPVDGRWSLDGPSVCAQVLDTGRPARIDEYRGLGGTVAETAQTAGFQSVAGAPIIVDGRVWGAIVVVSSSDPLPERSEVRVAEYTELVATAISNATTHAELLASRARIVAASDEARRRVERDLHDGIQQRLIALSLDVQTLRTRVPSEGRRSTSVSTASRATWSSCSTRSAISRGVCTRPCSRGAACDRRSKRSHDDRRSRSSCASAARASPEPVEVATYYAVSEALTNAIKHSRASVITIEIESTETTLRATRAGRRGRRGSRGSRHRTERPDRPDRGARRNARGRQRGRRRNADRDRTALTPVRLRVNRSERAQGTPRFPDDSDRVASRPPPPAATRISEETRMSVITETVNGREHRRQARTQGRPRLPRHRGAARSHVRQRRDPERARHAVRGVPAGPAQRGHPGVPPRRGAQGRRRRRAHHVATGSPTRPSTTAASACSRRSRSSRPSRSAST